MVAGAGRECIICIWGSDWRCHSGAAVMIVSIFFFSLFLPYQHSLLGWFRLVVSLPNLDAEGTVEEKRGVYLCILAPLRVETTSLDGGLCLMIYGGRNIMGGLYHR